MPRTKVSKPTRLMYGGTMKPARYRNGVLALREIRKYQKSVHLLLPKSRMALLIKEVAQEMLTDLVWRKDALLALQEGSEAYLVEVFQLANDFAINIGGRQTIQVCDIRMAVKMMERAHPFKRN